MARVSEQPTPDRVDGDAIMDEVRKEVRAELYVRLVAHGAADDFPTPQIYEAVDDLLRRSLSRDDRARLLLPDLFDEPWTPDLALRFKTHRPGLVGSSILFVKRRVLQPLMRWLFEYSLENFRKQDRVNVALMACLQALAADHVKLRLRVDALEAERAAAVPPPASGRPASS